MALFSFRSVFFHLICTFPAVYTIQAKRSPHTFYTTCTSYASYTFCELLPDSSPQSHEQVYPLRA